MNKSDVKRVIGGINNRPLSDRMMEKRLDKEEKRAKMGKTKGTTIRNIYR